MTGDRPEVYPLIDSKKGILTEKEREMEINPRLRGDDGKVRTTHHRQRLN